MEAIFLDCGADVPQLKRNPLGGMAAAITATTQESHTATERSDQIYSSYLEASQKFDYFVVGLALALVGYLGSRFTPMALGWNSSTIELASIISLLASGMAGLKRIETNVTLLGVMQKRLSQEEAAGALTSAALSGGPALNKSTGQVMWPADLLSRAQYHKVGSEVIGEKLEELATASGRWYRIRNFLLMLGLVLLVLARLAPAYFH